MTTKNTPKEEALRRARGEYQEKPGLSLTFAQAERLWALDPVACRALLDALVETRFLRRARDGTFVRENQ